MKVSKKVIPYAVMTSLAVSAVVAPAAAADAQAQYEAGFYIEMDGALQYLTAVEFAQLTAAEKEAFVLNNTQFVFVHANGTAASVDAIFTAGSVNAALAPVTAGLIKDGSYTTKAGEVKEVTEPVAVDPDPTDVTSEPVDPDPTDVTSEPVDPDPTDVVVDPDPVDGLAVESVSAINVDKLQVTLNQAVDKDDVTLTVTRLGRTTSVNSIEWSEDNTVVTITTTAGMVAGEYTVNVNSGGETIAAGAVEVKDQHVADIVILNETALTNTSSDTVYVFYDVLDQYGESLRNSTTISWNTSAGTASVNRAKGYLEIPRGTGTFNFGDKVFVTGVYARTGVSVSSTVQVGMKQSLNSIEIHGFLNKSTGEIVQTLPAGYKSNQYELVFDVLDQNGNQLVETEASAVRSQITFTSDNPLLMEQLNRDNMTPVVVDGEEHWSVPVVAGSNVTQGGEVNITAIATNTGNQVKFNTVVGQSQVLSSFTMSAPTSMIADGERVVIPFEAYDQNGESITNFHTLASQAQFNGLSFNVSESGARLELVEQADGTARLVYRDRTVNWNEATATNGINRNVSLTSIVVGGNTSGIMLSIQDKARPVAIASVDMNTVFVERGRQTVTLSSFDFLDQYGRNMTEGNRRGATDNNTLNKNKGQIYDNGFFTASTYVGEDFAGYNFLVKGSYRGTSGDLVAVGGFSTGDTIRMTTSTDTIILEAGSDVTASSKTGNSMRFEIAKEKDGEVQSISTARTVNFTIADIRALRNFTVRDLNKFYIDTGNGSNVTFNSSVVTGDSITADVVGVVRNQTVRVSGTFNGVTVNLPSFYLHEVTGNKLTTSGDGVLVDRVNTTGNDSFKYSDLYDATSAQLVRKDAQGTLTVNLRSSTTTDTVDIVTTTISISDEAPKATTIEGVDEITFSPTNTSIDTIDFISGSGGVFEILDKEFKVRDQYGDVMDIATTGVRLRATSVEENPNGFAPNNFSAQMNNSDNLRITGAERGDTFVLVITVGNVSKEVKVTVGADTNAKISSQDGNLYRQHLIGDGGALETQRRESLGILPE